MKLFTTTDIAESTRRAMERFTHVVLNRSYTTIKPVFFMSKKIADLPLYQFASWIPETNPQLARWREQGGVLVEQDTHPKVELSPDVTVMVECPLDIKRIEACNQRNREYGVLPHPKSWGTHEECIDLRHPVSEVLEPIWRVCAGKEMTNKELAEATGIPVAKIQYLKSSLKPAEYWYIQPRLAPERDEFIPAWDWLKSVENPIPGKSVRLAGHKAQIEEMARFGYVSLRKMLRYAPREPDWGFLDRKRETALSDLALVRSLVESLPDHPAT